MKYPLMKNNLLEQDLLPVIELLKTKDPIYSTRWEWGAGKMGKEPDNYKGEQHHLAMGLEHWPRGVDAGEGYGSASMWNDISEKNKLFFVVEYTNPACAGEQF